MRYPKKAVFGLLSLLLMFASFGFSIPKLDKAFANSVPTQDVMIGDFESDSDGWTFYPGSEFPGATGTFVRDGAVYHSGAYSGKLSGDFQGGGNYVSVNRNVPLVDAIELSFWVKTSDFGTISLRLSDSTGQTHQQVLSLQQTADWQQVKVTKFNGGTQYVRWGGANDGLWHGPAKGISLLLERSKLINGQKAGSAWIDGIVMKSLMPPLTINQVKVGNVFQEPEPAAFQILTQADSVTWTVYDYWGKTVAEQTEPVDGSGTKMLAIPGLRQGYYTLKVTAEQNGSPLKQAEQSFAVVAPYDLGQVSDSPFGMSTHFGQSWNPELIPLLQQAGAKNIRDELYWGTVEPQKGVYSFPQKYEQFMSELQNHSIKPFTIYSYTNQNYDNGSTPYTDEGRQGFADYGREIVRHYDSIDWVEAYNEFNIGFGDRGNGPADSRADYYFQLLKTTYQTVKADKPGVTVVGAATAGIPWTWLEELFKLGGLDYMDALSIHPYRYPGAPEGLAQELAKLQDLIKKYNNGQTKPIWITEFGWPTQLAAGGVIESTQADYIVRSHVVSLAAGVEKIFWYDFKNDGLNKTYNEHNFGIVRNEGDALGKYSPKPAYSAFAAMTRQLTDARYVRKEEAGEGIYSYVFDSAGVPIRVVWSTEPKQIKVKTDVSIQVTDIMGNEETFTPLQGYVYLTSSGSPLYVRGDIETLSEGSRFTLSGGQFVTGEPLSLVLDADNTEVPLGRIAASLEIDGQSYDIDVMPGYKKDIPISLPGEAVPQTKTVLGYIRSEGNPVGKLIAQVSIVDPVRLRVKHVLRENRDTVSLAVYNYSSGEYKLDRIDWQIGTQSGSVSSGLVIPTGSEGSIDVPVPALPSGQTYPFTLTLHAADLLPVVYKGNVNLVDLSAAKPTWEKTISVDGVPDDLSGVPAVSLPADGTVRMQGYAGTEDLSGQMRLTWDRDNLYLSATVHDDVFAQTAVADGIWQGDCIQFAVSQGMPGETNNWYEYGIALTGSGPQVYRWLSTEGKPTGLVSGAQLKVTRDEGAKNTVYELALPWSQLSPVMPDDGLLSFSMLVNDNDGQGRKGWIEWGSGIGSTKDSKLFKPVRLVVQP